MLYKEMSIFDFEPWSGAVNTYERLKREGKLDELDSLLPDMFGKDDVEETELNDLLWFEPDVVYELVGLSTESEIRKDIDETESEITYINEYITTSEEELEECETGSEEWHDVLNTLMSYRLDLEDLHNKLDELKEELGEL